MARGLSLRATLAIVFGALALVTTATLGIAAYVHTSRLVEADLRDRLHDLLGATAAGLDGAAHREIRSEADRTRPEFERVVRLLREVRRTSPDVKEIYTLRRDGEHLRFIVDAADDAATTNAIGSNYDEVTREQLVAYDLRDVWLEPALVHDRWGTWLSGTAPIVVDGKIDGVLGIDISAARLDEARSKQLWAIAIACALVAAGAMLFGAVIAGRIAKPLVAVEQELARLRTLELSNKFAVQSRIREIGSIGDAVVNMKNGLRSFRKYVPAELVADIVRSNQEAKVGAEHAELTIMFSDIAGFTSISEKLTPERVVKLLERYLEGMSQTLLDHDGTIDKFIGDAVMGFWGAPRPVPDHPVKACRAALACVAFLKAARADWERDGFPPVFARIGLHTGEVVVGNIGFDQRLSYTIIGDDVNLTSRLEGINKIFDTQILISEATRARTDHMFATRHLGKIVVKGREGPISVHELIATAKDVTPEDRAFATAFEAAWDLYAERDFAGALAGFEACANMRPTDRTTRIYLECCRPLVTDPPDDDWSPAIEMTDK